MKDKGSRRLNRVKFASQFSDDDKLEYFKRKISEFKLKNDHVKCHEYRVKLFNLEQRIEREKRESVSRQINDDFLNFD